MKYNFTVVNSSSSSIKAESNVSYVAPQDFVGEGRISRFRLSSTTFPLAFIQPSSRLYTSTQKNAITKEGITPTDLAFGFYIPYTDTSQIKHNPRIQNSAFYAPTNGVGSWYQGIRQESGAQSGTITVPHYRSRGMITFPILSEISYEAEPRGGQEVSTHPYDIHSEEIIYEQENKQNYIDVPDLTMSLNLGTSLSERMVKYQGAILNTTETVNTPLDPEGSTSNSGLNEIGGYIFICYYYLDETPMWEDAAEGDMFKLKNKGRFIHSWDLKKELGAVRTFFSNFKHPGYTDASTYTEITPVIFARTPSLNFVHINDTTFNVQLDCQVNFIDTYGVVGTPVLLMSNSASSLFKCETNPASVFAYFPLSTPIPFPDELLPEDSESSYVFHFKIPICESKLANPQAELVDYHVGLDFSSSFTLNAPSSIINPVTCLILTSPSLSFKGESISVDTRQLQGVISPSSLPILRTFYVGVDSNKERSDLVFVDDMLTSYAVIFNSPRIVNIKLALFALTKSNDLVLMEIPPGGDMAIQITIV